MANEVAKFQEPRLPYHPVLEERFGVTKTAWKALVEAVYPAAKTPDAVVMALAYCKARNLDPFKRPVHIVLVWDSGRGAMVETVWPGISELRTTAMRTKKFAGCDEVEFGPDVERHFEWTDRKNVKHEADVTYPLWARMTVYRMLGAERITIVGPKVYWEETYASQGKSDAPNEMWRKRPRGQLEKCAEAGALRRAFPEELGDEPTAEEMEGRTVHHAVDHAATMPSLTAGFGDKALEGPRTAEKVDPSDGTGDAPEAPSASLDAEGGAKNDEAAQDAEFEDAARPTETANAQDADAGQDTSASATDVSEGSPQDPSGQGEVDDSLSVGGEPERVRAPAGEVYLMDGDAVGEDGKRPTYKDGQPFSRISEKAAQKLTIYDLHAEPEAVSEAEDEEFPGDRLSTVQGAEINPMIEAIIKISEAPHYLAAKQVVKELSKTEAFKGSDDEGKRMVRLTLWDRYVELVEAKQETGQITDDFLLMRLFLEFGAKTVAEIENLWPTFWRKPAYKEAGEGDKRGISDLMVKRKAELPAQAGG